MAPLQSPRYCLSMADAETETIWQGDEEPEDERSIVIADDDEDECEPSD